jgi:hypothetical protein
MRNSNNSIGNRTSDLPVCSAVPQPTVPPRAAVDIVRKKCIAISTDFLIVLLLNFHTFEELIDHT